MNFEDLDLLERSEVYNFKGNKNMSNIWNLNFKDVSGALISAILSAVLMYITNLTSISSLDWHVVLGIAVTVGATSLLKSFSTTPEGEFMGIVKVK